MTTELTDADATPEHPLPGSPPLTARESDIPNPPGRIKPWTDPTPATLPEDLMNAAQLRLEVWRLQAIAKYRIPEEYQEMVQGLDASTINKKARSLAELLNRIK